MSTIFLSYPNLYYIIKGLFGIEISFLSILPTFGLLVMCAFFVASYILTRELKRKEAAGLMPGRKEKVKGSKNKELVMPHQHMGQFTLLAIIGGVIGARLFHILERLYQFIQYPVQTLFSRGGFTFYGGLLLAALLILLYAHKKRINLRHLLDSFAPALMLAYAIGRLGCQLSGDGDWGVYNTAYRVDSLGHTHQMVPGAFNKIVEKNQAHFLKRVASVEDIQHIYFLKPPSLNFLPDWVFAYGYPNNVLSYGVPIANCKEEKYCRVLPVSVFPTPLYEAIACFLLFLILWAVRKRITIPGVLFGIYMLMNGAERFLVEKIRVNSKYNIFGFHPTQAEIISAVLAIGGIVFIWYCWKNRPVEEKRKAAVL